MMENEEKRSISYNIYSWSSIELITGTRILEINWIQREGSRTRGNQRLSAGGIFSGSRTSLFWDSAAGRCSSSDCDARSAGETVSGGLQVVQLDGEKSRRRDGNRPANAAAARERPTRRAHHERRELDGPPRTHCAGLRRRLEQRAESAGTCKVRCQERGRLREETLVRVRVAGTRPRLEQVDLLWTPASPDCWLVTWKWNQLKLWLFQPWLHSLFDNYFGRLFWIQYYIRICCWLRLFLVTLSHTNKSLSGKRKNNHKRKILWL